MDRHFFRTRQLQPELKAGRRRQCRSQSPRRFRHRPTTSTAHNYEPLKTPRSIRLVEIVRYSKDCLEIFARLRDISLDDTNAAEGKFAALSYTWGPPVFSTEKWGPYSVEPVSTFAKAKLIVIRDGGYQCMVSDDNVLGDCSFVEGSHISEFDLTENLSDFLVSLIRRSEHCNEMIPPIWIDAICIDQTNPKEKAVQIPLMGEIYSRSSAVYIWLGKHDDDLKRLLWLYEELMPALQQRQKDLSSYPAFFDWLRSYGPSDDSILQELDIKLKNGSWADHWITYLMFYATRSWFFRAWTLQEAIVASNPVFVVGMDFHTLKWAAAWDLRRVVEAWGNRLSELTMYNQKLDKELQGIRLIRGWTELFPLRHTYFTCLRDSERKEWAQTWTILLFIARSKDCTVTQDRVYSTFGMAKMICPSDLRDFPDVDFSRTPAEVFAGVARFLLCNKGGLSLLSLVEDNMFKTTPGLPSWTPDFSIKGDQGHLLSSVPRFRASKHMPAQPLPRCDGNTIVFRGKRVGKIVFVPPNDGKFTPFSLQVALVIPHLPEKYPAAAESGAEALWRTLIFDFTSVPFPTGEGADPRLGQGFKQWLTVDLTVRLNGVNHGLDAKESKMFGSILSSDHQKAHNDLIPSLDEIHHMVHVMMSQQQQGGNLLRFQGELGRSYYTMMTPIITNRRLFVTDEGLVGLGKLSCREGDEVWIVAGGTTPYVMRRSEADDTYTLVGDAYVHGVMDGEWSSHEQDEVELRVI